MKRFKRIKALCVAAVLVFLTATVSIVSNAQESELPIIYVEGKGYTLYSKEFDTSSEKIYPIDTSAYLNMDFIKEKINGLNPIFLKAYITGDYDEYCDYIYDVVEPVFAKLRLDNNGEPSDGSGCYWNWSRDRLADTGANDGTYGLMDYSFKYDWRLDPCALADRLNAYIKDVLYVTGAPQVKIVSRCLGCSIVGAYLYEYGNDDVEKCIFYASSAEGADVCNGTFSGQIKIDPDAAEGFVYDYLGDDLIMSLLKNAVSVLYEAKGIDLASDFVDSVYKKISDNLIPRLIISTYGTFPGYYSMLGDEYELAIENIFGDNREEYAGLIKKTDHYHYDVQANLRKMIDGMSDETDFAVIAKYGYFLPPIVPDCRGIADGVVELEAASFGATCVETTDDCFSRRYINSAKSNGTYKYISPDKQVDASTCVLPDSTWIIKGMRHRAFPASANVLIMEFLSYDGCMTVNDDPAFPQYLNYDETTDNLTPMTEENCHDTETWEDRSLFEDILALLRDLIEVIREYLIPMLSEA